MSDIQGPFSSLIEDYTGVTTSNVVPAGQHRWYNKYDNQDAARVVYVIGDGTKTIAALDKHSLEKTDEEVDTTTATIAAAGSDHTVFVDTDTAGAAVTLTVTDAGTANDRLTVVAIGAYAVALTITGLTSEEVPIGEARAYVWEGSAWVLASGGGGATGDIYGNLGIGQTAWFAGAGSIPYDKLECDGTLYDIVDYPGLFGTIGILYGGDGTTTFAVPDLTLVDPEPVGRWLIQAFDTVQEVPADPGLIKDWVEKWEDGGAGNITTVTNSWGTGKFIIQGTTFNFGAAMLEPFTSVIELDDLISSRHGAYTGLSTGNSWLRYNHTNNQFEFTPSGSYYITKISRWEDVAGEDAQLNPPVDGWETIYDVPTSTGDVTLSVGDGVYEVVLSSGTNTRTANLVVRASGGSCSSPWDASYSASYAPSTGIWTSGAGTYNIVRIRKFNSLVNVVHSYHSTIEEVDTDAGDVAIVLPANPAAGTIRSYYNIGTSGNYVTGLPNSIELGDGQGIQITYGGTGWRYEDVMIDEYTSGDQTVTKWAGGRMEISGIGGTGANPDSITLAESFVNTTGLIAQVSANTGSARWASFGSLTVGSFLIYRYSYTGTDVTIQTSFTVTGRWKTGI